MENRQAISKIILQVKNDIIQYIEDTDGMNKEEFGRKADISRSTILSILSFQEGDDPPNITMSTFLKINTAID